MGGMTKALRQRCEYAALVAVATVIRLCPWPVTRALGRALGRTFYLLDGAHRRLTIENLQAAFPARSLEECRTLAKATFQHFGRLALDLLKFQTLTPAAMLEMVDVSGAERVEQAQARGRGTLFLTGHFGFWEIQALAHGLRFGPMSVMARPLDNPHLHDFLERARTTTGNSVIYRRGALRRVFRTLAANGAVGILIDQHVQSRDAVHVDFFNRPASTTAALAVLAARTGAPVIPLFALPLSDGRYPADLRAGRRAAGQRNSRSASGVHAAVHRRPGDVRSPTPESLALDASAMARSRVGARADGRHVSGRAVGG